MTKVVATIDFDYLQGHLRYGSKSILLEGKDAEMFLAMTKKEQEQYVDENGEWSNVDYSIEDTGNITSLTIKKE